MKENAITLDGRQYLEVKYRIKEFRREQMNHLCTEIAYLEDDMAVIKATAYSGTVVVGEAYACRHVSVEERFLEMAETAAIGRALSDAGYNLPYEEVAQGDDPLKKYILLDDGTPYLEVCYRIAWMRHQHPDWLIRKTLLRCTRNFAVMQCSIVDGKGTVLSLAHARRQWSNSDVGQQFVESAETAASGRALAILGYDLPPETSRDLNDGRIYSESPIREENRYDGNMLHNVQGNVAQNAPQNVPRTFPVRDFSGGFDPNAFLPPGDEEEVPFFSEDAQTFGQSRVMTGQQSTEPYQGTADVVIPFGIYSGQRLKDVYEKDRPFVENLAFRYKGDPALIDAAKKIIS